MLRLRPRRLPAKTERAGRKRSGGPRMFEKYTEKAKKVLFLARYEASQMGSKVIGSEHLLLGLIKEGDDLVRDLFGRSGVNLELLRAELEARGPSGEKQAARSRSLSAKRRRRFWRAPRRRRSACCTPTSATST